MAGDDAGSGEVASLLPLNPVSNKLRPRQGLGCLIGALHLNLFHPPPPEKLPLPLPFPLSLSPSPSPSLFLSLSLSLSLPLPQQINTPFITFNDPPETLSLFCTHSFTLVFSHTVQLLPALGSSQLLVCFHGQRWPFIKTFDYFSSPYSSPVLQVLDCGLLKLGTFEVKNRPF